jgi:endonuclease/exonuclease/phosphatase family metal-dependent hydrolase
VKIVCVTINLKGMEYDWLGARGRTLVNELDQWKPDVVCFQETTIRQETPLYNQARKIALELGLGYTIFSPYGNLNEIVTRDQGGVAIASRWPSCDVRTRGLLPGHSASPDNRVCIFATLDTPDGQVGVATTHLSWRPEEKDVRLVQAGLIVDELIRTSWEDHGRYILLGDFNAIDSEPAIVLIAEKMKDSYRCVHEKEPGFTWSTKNLHTAGWNLPDRRIDYIFCSKTARVTDCKIILDEAKPVMPSDHFGVLAEIEWK